jgi:hypothetical protein
LDGLVDESGDGAIIKYLHVILGFQVEGADRGSAAYYYFVEWDLFGASSGTSVSSHCLHLYRESFHFVFEKELRGAETYIICF